MELDHERSAVSWDVEIQGKNGAEHDVTVNASTGKIIAASVDHDDRHDGSRHADRDHEDHDGADHDAHDD
ncbi:PepSY domain-containing protein [Streptomyces natalensis]|uniref:PepSY domain-containing protein n=1 Tax=Streptomyces natalensis TaxID=68242 RepID=UPI0004ABC291|nr:hypothetical protein [Streptomyces natalensis]